MSHTPSKSVWVEWLRIEDMSRKRDMGSIPHIRAVESNVIFLSPHGLEWQL